MMLRYQLLRPLAYLAIDDRSKWQIDLLIPAIFAVVQTLLIFSVPLRPMIYLNGGLISQLLGLLQIMPGFYLAALAAIATFNRADMDGYMPQPTPTVRVQIKGVSLPI